MKQKKVKIVGSASFRQTVKAALAQIRQLGFGYAIRQISVVKEGGRFAHQQPGQIEIGDRNISTSVNAASGLIHLGSHLFWPGGGEFYALGNEVNYLISIGRFDCAARIQEARRCCQQS